MAGTYWEQWISTLSDIEAAAAIVLRDRFAQLGAPNPEDWAGSELREGMPQLARFLVLRRLRNDAVDGWRHLRAIEAVPAAKRLLDHGADIDDLSRAMRAAAYEAAFAVLSIIDDGYDPEADDGFPKWSLREIYAGALTGRAIDSLHESFLTLDPSGTDGTELWA